MITVFLSGTKRYAVKGERIDTLTGEATVTQVIDIHKVKIACEECSLVQLCLPAGLELADMRRLDDLVEERYTFQSGETLYQRDEPMRAVYAVRSGCVKSYVMGEQGEAQIIGFHLPGELVGLDAIATTVYQATATALEITSVCAIPFDSLAALSQEIPSLNHHLWRIMSREIGREGEALQLLNGKNAAAKLANFLLSLSERFQERKLSNTEFNLSMTRHEIGNYLGLAIETVSRSLTSFQNQGLVNVRGKYVQITDLPGLHEIAGHSASACAGRKQRG